MDLTTVGLIVGSLSIVAAFCGLALTAFIFYRVREDIAELNRLRSRQDAFEERLVRASTISNELVNVLYDLYSMSAGYKAIAELQSLKMPIDEALFEALNEDFDAAEKHFAELGLFSADPERRVSVAQSLSNSYGDFGTYVLLSDLVAGKYGEKLSELKPYKATLGDRLGGFVKTTKQVRFATDVRTDGGAF